MAASPTITFRVSDETEAALNALSEVSGRPVAELVREGVDLLLADLDESTLLKQLEESRRLRDDAMRSALKAAVDAKQRTKERHRAY